MDRFDLIFETNISDTKIRVLKGNLLSIKDVAKVLPTNEDFNVEDSDWEQDSSRSLVGQYLKMSHASASKMQKQIKNILSLENEIEHLSYPFGHTIALNYNNDQLLFTVTVKYEMQSMKMKLEDIQHDAKNIQWFYKEEQDRLRLRHIQRGEGTERYHPQSLVEQEYNHINQKIIEAEEEAQIYYDTFLMAIGQCVENIVKIGQGRRIEKIAIPLLGAGWGS